MHEQTAYTNHQNTIAAVLAESQFDNFLRRKRRRLDMEFDQLSPLQQQQQQHPVMDGTTNGISISSNVDAMLAVLSFWDVLPPPHASVTWSTPPPPSKKKTETKTVGAKPQTSMSDDAAVVVMESMHDVDCTIVWSSDICFQVSSKEMQHQCRMFDDMDKLLMTKNSRGDQQQQTQHQRVLQLEGTDIVRTTSEASFHLFLRCIHDAQGGHVNQGTLRDFLELVLLCNFFGCDGLLQAVVKHLYNLTNKTPFQRHSASAYIRPTPNGVERLHELVVRVAEFASQASTLRVKQAPTSSSNSNSNSNNKVADEAKPSSVVKPLDAIDDQSPPPLSSAMFTKQLSKQTSWMQRTYVACVHFLAVLHRREDLPLDPIEAISGIQSPVMVGHIHMYTSLIDKGKQPANAMTMLSNYLWPEVVVKEGN